MARNTLEAVFGALGAGLTGFGRERQQRTEDEERRRREALQESMTAANMIASGQFGTEAQLRASGGQAFRTAGQLAAGALPMAQGTFMPSGGARRVLPSADELSNLGTAARRGATPPMFEVGGQRLGVIRSKADEQRELMNRELQAAAVQREQTLADAAVARQQRLADEAARDAREQVNRIELAREQGRQARATASVPRISSPSATTAQPGDRGVLPTVTGAIADLRLLTPSDIRGLRAGNVQTIQETPDLVSQARGPFEYGGARLIQYLGNVQASEAEQRYALQARAVSDAVARANERGVLSNQDNSRYIRQVSLVSGDREEIKEMKVRNLIAWAEWLSNANQMLATGATAEQVKAAGTAHANQLESQNFATWTTSNPQGRSESDENYVARFRREMGVE